MGSATSHTSSPTPLVTNDLGVETQVRVDADRNLRVGFPFGLKFVTVTDPGVAYANGVNALCLANPPSLDEQIRIASVGLSAKAAGDFYLVVAALGTVAGATTNNVFDLQGIRGEVIASTCDVVWAAFLSAQTRSASSPGFILDCGVGNELYLIAPDIVYSLIVTWREEIAEA